MLCTSTRYLFQKNLSVIAAISGSLNSAKKFSSSSNFNPKSTPLGFKPISPICGSRTKSFSCNFSGVSQSEHSMASQSHSGSVHDFTVKDAKGNDVDLSIYKGKALLIVNVASQCGLTNSNYTELSQLYQKYKDQGLEILAFPCNQFGAQEPGSNDEIVEFACTRFKAEYPIFDKVDVNGDNAAPIYKYLKSSKGSLFGDSIKWNFSKFLVDKEGKVVDRYAPTTSPLSIEKDVKKLLGVA
ncbi:probable phospholipid hydroperoxide glutathione peroxidase isoform X1 [Humulus lupulus]|uniref:probable phospholipid hydroperoxide glutathione peroxidase isoform X1 n=1 Tax=Humulus lupulus TaxID=3486 RepID=UPI002B41749F|nr:probable phospholipid hydroperoxide glutathione peroxidase isoform X1 [Humulus lupulus]